MMPSSYALLGAVVLLAQFTGCSSDNSASALPNGRVVDSAGGTVALGLRRITYRASATPASATVSGRITLLQDTAAGASDSATAVAADTAPAIAREKDACASNGGRMEHAGGSPVPNALVWIDGMATGKPLPEMRRVTFSIARCGFQPRVLATVSPSTVNVYSGDEAVHLMRFYREGAGAVDSVRTVDEGQVVPSERIAAVPGIVEVRCALHPGERGFIAVFAHPYFAVTGADGRFTMDSLPAGTYTVKVWHERLTQPVTQRLVVQPGGAGRVDLSLALR